MPSLASFLIPGSVVVVVGVMILIMASLRQVVPTNMVHIVQRRKKTTSYGTKQAAGNVYYRWPSWVPGIGVTVIVLPVSNFDLSLKDYEAYDKDRVPFRVDVTAFFRIEDTAIAAQRVESVKEMDDQLLLIVQGAVRKVLASDNIDSIMLERSKFGNSFTEEVRDQLEEWGVKSVKSMELMDIRDTADSKVIANIMAKKTSFIEMESRTEVARNQKTAETAEIEAKQAVDIRQQEADEAVGQRTAAKDKAVGIANEQASQEVLSQKKETASRNMDVRQVEQVREAEIAKEREIVAAEQTKQTTIIRAEGELEGQRREAQAIETVGKAKAEAEKAMKMAPVQAQIALAQEIGENEGYQQYLAILEAIKGYIAVGTKQAEALVAADVKVIANAGNPTEGVGAAMQMFSSKGGTQLAATLEAFAQSPLGEAVLTALGVQNKKDNVHSDPQPPAATPSKG